MLNFRKQIVDLKKQTLIEKGKKCERDVKAIANQVLQSAFDELKKKTPSIILDFQGVIVTIVGMDIYINYFDVSFNNTFILSMYEGENKKKCVKIFDTLKEILKEDGFSITEQNKYAFRAYL